MNPEKITYTIQWKQEYTEWEKVVEENTEVLLDWSEYKEANEVIERIKNL